jgi:4-amino-4-deoxy-L-arabinose transferase-like glycosyltransferase
VRTNDAAAVHVETLSSWMTSPRALVLIVLAGTGIIAVARAVPREARRDAYLCASLVVALAAFASVAHPPASPPYFVALTPFVAILSSIGAFAAARRINRLRGRWAASTIVALLASGALLSIYRERLWVSEWRPIEAFADEVNRVTAPGGSIERTSRARK